MKEQEITKKERAETKEKAIEKAITIAKNGKKELRILIDKGSYVRYKYIDISTNKDTNKETFKYSLLLIPSRDTKTKYHTQKEQKEHWFIIKLKNNKELITKKLGENKEIVIYDEKNNKLLKI